jgi:LCP family protein required for cell wall assembly
MTPSPSPSLATDAVLGADGRFTVLLLGSDYRAAHPGNRTDVIMVVSLDPTTGAVAAASIPRDTASFPTSAKGVYKPKVNGLYQALIGKMGQTKAAREMKRIVGAGIGVEIDAYAVIGFEGVRRLIDTVGGVDVTLAKSVSDSHYWVNAHHQGVYFPKGRNHLNGERALIFARTRKGDNDFERARRQQMLVAAAVDAVRSRGLAKLPALLGIASRFVKTDLPLTAAPELFALVAKADLGNTQRVVFGPTKWASGGSGTSFSLKLGEVRGWTKRWMAPVAAASPSPSSSPAASPAASPTASP